MKVNVCPKCNQQMEDGFTIDVGYASKTVASWISGKPEHSFWQSGPKTSDRRKIEISTFRCTACGYLESYAN
jgi:predicted nucleic-acid-binding Zn-ribbon protein